MAGNAQLRAGAGDINRTCGSCGQDEDHDDDPRHIVIGIGTRTETVSTPDGRMFEVQVPYDGAYHLDCHAQTGCEHCAGMLDAHDGSVKGKAASLSPPDHLVDPPHAWRTEGPHGVLRRVEVDA